MDSTRTGIAAGVGKGHGTVALRSKGKPGHAFSETRLFACFEDLGLERELYYKRVNEISGGQRQRMMIAVASMIGKPLTIVDEPTSALDSGSAEKVLSFFRRQTEKEIPY